MLAAVIQVTILLRLWLYIAFKHVKTCLQQLYKSLTCCDFGSTYIAFESMNKPATAVIHVTKLLRLWLKNLILPRKVKCCIRNCRYYRNYPFCQYLTRGPSLKVIFSLVLFVFYCKMFRNSCFDFYYFDL